MTLEEAEALAERTLAAIVAAQEQAADYRHYYADRERVASDLAGLRDCWWRASHQGRMDEPHATRYTEGLLRTARLWGEA